MNVPSAFFVLFAHDIESPSFPHTGCGGFDCSRYDLFVVSPLNFTRAHVAKLKSAGRPGSHVLGYFDTAHVPILGGCATGHSFGDHAGKNCSQYGQCGDGPYLEELRAVFPVEYADRWSNNESIICSYPGLADHVPHAESVAALVPLLAKTARSSGFDGLYLDNRINAELFAGGARAASFDRGAAVSWATTKADAIAMYTAWAPALSSGLRRALGPDAIIIGNSAGALSDPALNGITLEMEACASRNCTDAALAQAAVGAEPSVGVFWLTHAEAMPAKEQCERVREMQRLLPWMRAGTDFIDLSHIVCNATGASGSGATPRAQVRS